MSDIEWSPWVKGDPEPFARFSDIQVDGQCYRIPMEDYKRITGMPDWSEAPKSAIFLAQDEDGKWFWFAGEPNLYGREWNDNADDGPWRAGGGEVLGDWRGTLQERPSDQLESHPNSELDADQYTVGGDSLFSIPLVSNYEMGLYRDFWAKWGERNGLSEKSGDNNTLADCQQSDLVNMPSHYTSGEIECIDAIQAQMTPEQFAGYLRGNCVKYIWRYQHKGGKESLLKAQWYLNRLIDVVE